MSIKWTSIVDTQFIIAVLAVLFYTYILYLVMSSKSKTLQSAFFLIFAFTGVFDITCIIALEWTRQDEKNGFGPSFELITRIAMATTGTNFLPHIVGCLLMTLNRFTAVFYPNDQQRIWSKRNVCVTLVIVTVCSFLLYTPLYAVRFCYIKDNASDTGWKFNGREHPIDRIQMMSGSIILLYELFNIILITRTVIGMSKGLNGGTFKRSQQLRLLIVMAVSCVLSTVEAFYEFLSIFRIENAVFDWILRQFNTYFFFLLTLNAYSILFLSKAVREELIRRWRKILPQPDRRMVILY